MIGQAAPSARPQIVLPGMIPIESPISSNISRSISRRVREIVEACPDLGVRYVTIFAFSTENWRRTQSEVAGLMSLFRRYITKEARALFEENVRVRFIGDRVRLDKKLVSLMDELELMTSGCTGVNLTIAINYGGRDEVARATRRLAQDVAAGKLDPDAVNEETLPKYLDTCVLPDPDLVIRTSGEARISNFLLWQSAYAEYEFIDTLWPDFCAEEFGRLLLSDPPPYSQERILAGLRGLVALLAAPPHPSE